ncbi:GNAT family N-acetyltransferase [Lampropedia aestuarii]|uniref:GNAT family N-acetyltransferase n=1 Tax=Lampropedia aestuarii TaxID=2562762 RepID=A0A4S5BEH9_9BURK|nr:GNAT family N-acetyltransferase [Lampropedia aestuarii]THJ30684.1 GNAT family N-acetyltransferase [Lampropedia aestuarii]
MSLPPFEINTARLLLRPFTNADLDGVYQGLSDPKVVQHYGVSYSTLEETSEQMYWYQHIQQTGVGQWWCICLASHPDRLIGGCGLNDLQKEHRRAEIGYWLLPAFWHQGFATEAVAAMLEYAFQTMKLHRIGADVDLDNHTSANLLLRLGFTREGVRRGFEIKNAHPIDLQLFSLLATDSPAR